MMWGYGPHWGMGPWAGYGGGLIGMFAGIMRSSLPASCGLSAPRRGRAISWLALGSVRQGSMRLRSVTLAVKSSVRNIWKRSAT